ncbi:phosphoadenylyl-sulfate reductase [Fulvivirgaceae bacterium LMO-SS25]
MDLSQLQSILTDNPKDNLDKLHDQFGRDMVFSTSFGIEDQYITYLISKMEHPVSIFTLDTGRLFPETYDVWSRTLIRYKLPITPFFPNQGKIQAMVEKKGPNSFYDSVEDRKECCRIRKIDPLQQAIKGRKLWVTGLRAEQSASRNGLSQLEYDEHNNIIKYHPLLNLTWEELNQVVDDNNIPINTLHKKGFPSIGCQPCTRAVMENEDFRDGRWWWENSKKECGLHS